MTTFDPTLGRRIAPAWHALDQLLADGDWHRWSDAIDTMLGASDLRVKTCTNLLRSAVRNGDLEQFGQWAGPGDDRRYIRTARPATTRETR